jgi:hypothetical protein
MFLLEPGKTTLPHRRQVESQIEEETLSEREMQSSDEETAICHVCDQRFRTQGELLKHLEETHPRDLLPDVPETDQD